MEPEHLAVSPHFADNAHGRADHPDALHAAARAAPMPLEDMTRRTDAARSRRNPPRLAITARPEPRHELRKLPDMPSGRRSTYRSRARRRRTSAVTLDAARDGFVRA